LLLDLRDSLEKPERSLREGLKKAWRRFERFEVGVDPEFN
jgi:hypothetical protein